MKSIQLPNNILLGNVGELIAEGHTVSLRVYGNSMRPLLEGGRDKATLAPFDTLNINDIVLAEINTGQYVLHRIIAIDGEYITLMGDGNIKGTEVCKETDITAKVISAIRNGKEWKATDKKWKLYTFTWAKLKFARRILLAAYKRIN